MRTQRKSGYYWVRSEFGWHIAMWAKVNNLWGWRLVNNLMSYRSKDFIDVIEERIKDPSETNTR